MTTQIKDQFHYQGHRYFLTAYSEQVLFDPDTLGIAPDFCSTACYRGYQAVFALRSDRLVLKDLHVTLEHRDGEWRSRLGPAINGLVPRIERTELDIFNNHYDDVNYPLNYSGGVLLTRDLNEPRCLRWAFHPTWPYDEVRELTFHAGALTGEFDQSRRSEELFLQFSALPLVRKLDDRHAAVRMSDLELKEVCEQACDPQYRRFELNY